MGDNYELELYKLCCSKDNRYRWCYTKELGWVNDKEFLVWVDYTWLREFMEQMTKIFGSDLYTDGSFTAYVRETGICFDLVSAVGDYVDIETVFPKDKYQH